MTHVSQSEAVSETTLDEGKRAVSLCGTTGQEEDVSLGLTLGIEKEDNTEESRAETRVRNTCPGDIV